MLHKPWRINYESDIVVCSLFIIYFMYKKMMPIPQLIEKNLNSQFQSVENFELLTSILITGTKPKDLKQLPDYRPVRTCKKRRCRLCGLTAFLFQLEVDAC